MKRRKKHCMLAAAWVVACVLIVSGCRPDPAPDATRDGSVWEAVIEAGFGNENNSGIVALAEYQGSLYAMTRNESQGTEVWRTGTGSDWEQVLFQEGHTNGVYGNPWLNSMWGAMVVFQGWLYCGFSSGHQARVYDSTGCEIWRYDGSVWEPVISDRKDTEDEGVITAIASCDPDDGDTTARITDATQSWEPDEWSGGVLQITSGEGRFRRFEIIGNTEDTLIVQQKEIVGSGAEYTVCAARTFENPSPPFIVYERGAVCAGDSYAIGTGADENGFGDFWNKTITDMRVYQGRLYVSTGLNSAHGAQVWYSEDGDTWTVTEPAGSFGNFHTNPDYPNGQKPVSSSITSLVPYNGFLYAGATGTSGELGGCARMARLTDSGWEMVVSACVDENDTGTNENGFGDGMDCNMWSGNWMPWSLVVFNDALFAGIQSLGGARVLYSPDGSPEDGSWFYSAGGDADLPNGFDGVQNRGIWLLKMYQNIAAGLYVFDGELYAGLVANYSPKLGMGEKYLTGAQLWRTSDGRNWVPVTMSGFADRYAVSISAFGEFNGSLYVGIDKASGDGPDGMNPAQGGLIYRMVSQPAEPAELYDEVHAYEDAMSPSQDPVDIYLPDPDGGQSFPVALLLQGAYCDKSMYSKFAEIIARYGFIVVVPNHYREYDIFGMPMQGLFAEQQQIFDVLAFAADQNSDPASALFGRVDTQRLVLLGHSFGAAAALMAVQNRCMEPFCPRGGQFIRPAELKAVALSGIKGLAGGRMPTQNMGLPLAIVNGQLDHNATYTEAKRTYANIQDAPKAAVFVLGSNHYVLSNENNPDGPSADPNGPTLDQDTGIETAARWSALFLRAHALDDQQAWNYVYRTGAYLDEHVEVVSEPGN